MEDLFDIYEKSRSLTDLQPLYNGEIYLHEITKNGNDTKRSTELNTEGKRLVKGYDIINGKMTFTKIIVY